MKGTVRLKDGMRFVGVSDSAHEITMDAALDNHGADSAPRPLELFLIGLGGCTGMDVVSILRKKQVEYESFEMDIAIDRATDYPKVFSTIKIVYRFTGKNIPRAVVEKAAKDSLDKYSSAAAMLRWGARLDSTIEITEI